MPVITIDAVDAITWELAPGTSTSNWVVRPLGANSEIIAAVDISEFGPRWYNQAQQIDDNPPESNLIKSKKLCILRPEMLAFLDFQSVSPVGWFNQTDQNTALFTKRVVKRKAQVETATTALQAAADLDPDNYTVALTQYESAVAAASSEIALLKIAYIFKTYAELGPSFTSFINFYTFDYHNYTNNTVRASKSGLSSWWQFMLKTMKWQTNGMHAVLGETILAGKDATLFLQFINDLSYSCCFGTPLFAMQTIKRFPTLASLDLQTPNTEILNVFTFDANAPHRPFFSPPKSGIVRLCRDLTASTQIGKIVAAAGDEDETLKTLIEKYADSDYFTSTVQPSPSMFKSVMGWDPFGAVVPNIAMAGSNTTTRYYLTDFIDHDHGLVSELFTLDKRTMVLSTDTDEYQSGPVLGADVPTNTYTGVKTLVDAGFASEGGIDLGLYESQITKLQDNLEDASAIFKQLFRLLDKRGSTLSSKIPAQNSHPTSPLNFYVNIAEVINDRYFVNAPAFIGLDPQALANAGEGGAVEDFYKCWGIQFMLTFPDLAKGIIEKFVDDYFAGYLTFTETSEITTVSIPGQKVGEPDTVFEVETRTNVLPGTETAVDIGQTRGSLYAYLDDLHDEIRDSSKTMRGLIADKFAAGVDWAYVEASTTILPIWQPGSPTVTFAGSIYTETAQAEYLNALTAQWSSTLGIDFDAMDAQVAGDIDRLVAWQQACVWWVCRDGKRYNANIIPVAGCVIDAVMTVLYNCLSPVMNIATAAGDPYFPSVECRTPPYHKQTMDIWSPQGPLTTKLNMVAGMGSFTNVNTDYWVPVLEAIRTSMVRPEDQTTYFSGTSLGEILGGVVDAFAVVGGKATAQLKISFAGNADPEQTLYAPAALSTVQSSESIGWPSIPTFSGETNVTVGQAKMINRGMWENMAQLTLGSDIAAMSGAGSWSSGENYIGSAIGSNSTSTVNYFWAGYGAYVFGATSGLYTVNHSGGTNHDATPSQLLDMAHSLNLSTTAWDEFLGYAETGFSSVDTTTAFQALLSALNIWSQVDEGGMVDALPHLTTLATAQSWIQTVDKFPSANEWATAGSDMGASAIPKPIWLMINMAGAGASDSPYGFVTSTAIDDIYKIASAGLVNTGLADMNKPYWANDLAYGTSLALQATKLLCVALIDCRDEDLRLGMGFDILEKYGQRIADYAETAIDGLTTEDDSDPSALETLLGDLGSTTPGQDVLENLTPQQLTLKTAGLQRQIANPDEGYISHAELITDSELLAIKLMMGTSQLLGEEGRNIKTSVLGIPAGLFSSIPGSLYGYSGPVGTDLNGKSRLEVGGPSAPLFGVKVSVSLPDHPIFQVVPKIFRFDNELFVLPDAFDNVDMPNILSWQSLVHKTTFTRLRFMAEEGGTASSEEIVKFDLEQKEVFADGTPSSLADLDVSNLNLYDIYSNTLASYLLEKYYKLMVGLAMMEDDFSTAGAGLGIPINEYAVDFAGALSSIYTDLESNLDSSKIDELFIAAEDIEGISYSVLTPSAASNSSIATYNTMVNSFSTEIAAAEFTQVEASLFESFTNAASSRLFSAEAMRDKILGAKYFDRVLYILVDPDEFLISSFVGLASGVSSGTILPHYTEVPISTVYLGFEDQLIADNTLEYVTLQGAPDPESTSTSNLGRMKIKRHLDEGEMSFSSMMFTIERVRDTSQKFGVTISTMNSGGNDEMIDSGATFSMSTADHPGGGI